MRTQRRTMAGECRSNSRASPAPPGATQEHPRPKRSRSGKLRAQKRPAGGIQCPGGPSPIDVTDLAAELGIHSGSPPAVLDSH